MKPTAYAVLAGLVLSAAAWMDPLFTPLVLLGPPLSGAVCGWVGQPLRWVAIAWAVAGVGMLVSDWAINNEDQLFHLVITVILVALAAFGWLLGGLRHRRRARAATS